MSKITVKDIDITVINVNNDDYISLTDMIRAKDGNFFITDWLRNRSTLDFLSIWEELNNPDFNYGEYTLIKNQSGVNSFKISVKEWGLKTNGIGLVSKSGRYGGTFAHKDIAFEFGTWISPGFKLYLIREFQRLKNQESQQLQSTQWDFRRFLSKVNHQIHTDAIKDVLIPIAPLNKDQEGIIYASEAELLNMAMFGITSKEWKEDHPEEHLRGMNIRDLADIVQLTVLANLESHNADMIRNAVVASERLSRLRQIAIEQLKSLRRINYPFSIESPHGILNKPE